MTNKKFKMAAMSLALTACVAASPLAANAEAPENTSDAAQPSAVQHEDEPETAEAPSAAADETVPDAPKSDVAPEQEPAEGPAEQPTAEEAPAAEPEAEEVLQETPDAEQPDDDAAPEEEPRDDAVSEEEPAAQPADDIAVLPTQPEEKPVAAELSSADEEPSSEKAAPTTTVPEESSDTDTRTTEDAAAQPFIQLLAANSTAAAETAGIAADDPYGISTMLPDEGSMRAVSNGEAMIAGNENVVYGTIDDAIKNAADGATIEVREDSTCSGILLADKKLTLAGVDKTVTEDGKEKKVKPKLTFTNGISIKNAELILKNLDVDMTGVGSTPNVIDGQTWMGICLAGDSTLTLDETDLTMDGSDIELESGVDPTGGVRNPQAIYLAGNGHNFLNIINDSHVLIQNYFNAIKWDGVQGNQSNSQYNINITGNSSLTADHNEAGIVGRESLDVLVEDSALTITNCTARYPGREGRDGTNGCDLTVKNSTVNVSNNAQAYGIYAHNFYAEDSTITANNNGYSGIRISGKGQFVNSNVTVTGTLAKGNAALELTNVKGEQGGRNIGSLEVRNSALNISGNGAVGIRCNSGTKLDIDDISRVTIKNNHATNNNGWNAMYDHAGGLLLCSGASAKLGANTIINNNHADKAGDDLYLAPGSSLTFSVRNATGNGDLLDDCGDRIDGWYLDAEGNYRWNFHGDPSFAQNLLSSDVLLVENGDGTYTLIVAADSATGLALKAAHAELPAPDPDDSTPITPDDPTPNPPEENSPVLPENPELPPVQDARADTPDSPVLPQNPVLPAVQDAHALPQTGMNLFAALAMALSGFALMAGGAFASLTGKNARH